MDQDHRELNRDLRVFATDPLAGAGLPLWLPDGAAIRDELQRLAKDLAHADGCVDVYTPVLGKRELFERSGHLAKFSGEMFAPIPLGEDEVVLRPANCPHHALVYAADQHSYRDLPIRLNELGAMFRAERSGVLSGLSRVRQINLDDTHVFCRPDQAAAEAARGLRTALRAQRLLGLPVDYVRLSRRDDGDAWLGSAEQWLWAEEELRTAAEEVLACSACRSTTCGSPGATTATPGWAAPSSGCGRRRNCGRRPRRCWPAQACHLSPPRARLPSTGRSSTSRCATDAGTRRRSPPSSSTSTSRSASTSGTPAPTAGGTAWS